MDRTTWRGRRGGAAFFYLDPALSRPNLEVRTRVLVSRITIDEGRATGVELAGPGGLERVRAEREVICCAGAVDSPRILQRSGVGDPDLLRGLGIEVSVERPGVGANLQDHPEIYVQFRSKLPVTLYPALKPWNQIAHRRPLAPHRNRDRGVESLRGGARSCAPATTWRSRISNTTSCPSR